jgi:hypothetical protein
MANPYPDGHHPGPYQQCYATLMPPWDAVLQVHCAYCGWEDGFPFCYMLVRMPACDIRAARYPPPLTVDGPPRFYVLMSYVVAVALGIPVERHQLRCPVCAGLRAQCEEMPTAPPHTRLAQHSHRVRANVRRDCRWAANGWRWA